MIEYKIEENKFNNEVSAVSIEGVGEYLHYFEIYFEDEQYSFCWKGIDKNGEIAIDMNIGRSIKNINDLKEIINNEYEEEISDNIGVLAEGCYIVRKFFNQYGNK